ncbi:MAG: HAD family hydrolase [Candidatus Bathyarchaeia archaeon]|nr:HAD family hydrolase [Candidatus Bathyarchaeota archaeon]
MVKVVSFDMDGTLVDYSFIDAVWFEGVPMLYAERWGVSMEEALETVTREYDRVGEDRPEWYDIKYWLNRFGLSEDWRGLLNKYIGRIRTYDDVFETLRSLEGRYILVLNSNSPREFLDLELEHSGLEGFFHRVFSSTSDFHQVRKTGEYYVRICELLGVSPREMVHIGDNLKFDFQIPREVGIFAVYLDRKGYYARNSNMRGEAIVINSLKQLGEILEGIDRDC